MFVNRKTFILIEQHQWNNIIHAEYITFVKDFRESVYASKRANEQPKVSWMCVQCEVRARFDRASRCMWRCLCACAYIFAVRINTMYIVYMYNTYMFVCLCVRLWMLLWIKAPKLTRCPSALLLSRGILTQWDDTVSIAHAMFRPPTTTITWKKCLWMYTWMYIWSAMSLHSFNGSALKSYENFTTVHFAMQLNFFFGISTGNFFQFVCIQILIVTRLIWSSFLLNYFTYTSTVDFPFNVQKEWTRERNRFISWFMQYTQLYLINNWVDTGLIMRAYECVHNICIGELVCENFHEWNGKDTRCVRVANKSEWVFAVRGTVTLCKRKIDIGILFRCLIAENFR